MLEVCVDTIAGVYAAHAGGAGRVELCASLSEGGLTPSAGLMQAAAQAPIPCVAMIRPRSGLFMFSDAEVDIMLGDIAAARAAGLAGVVLGVQTESGALNLPVLRQLSAAADGMARTLHRVIDVVPDPLAALDQAMSLGFDRVLTSGAQPEAPEGVPMIAKMVVQAQGRISVMPGCGLTPSNVAKVMAQTGVTEVHAACRAKVVGDPAFSDFDPLGGAYETSVDDVRQMVAQVTQP